MGKSQREKGKRFERWVASQLRAAFPAATVRRSSQADAAYEPDVVIEGAVPTLVKLLWLELTDGAAPNPMAKLEQAERDAKAYVERGHALPVVVWHKTGGRKIQATMRLRTLIALEAWPAPSPAGALDATMVGMPVTVDWEQLLAQCRWTEERA